ncbi:MAG: RNA pseudouridine synthase [Crocinitomicaceae bacterium]|nr:MAG: RNA pseudouridine synthase [Crocinitomicaceae bacterium]
MYSDCFHPFLSDIEGIELPTVFAYPHFYSPHPLAKIAASELQQWLTKATDLNHTFGLDNERLVEGVESIGKMFGVLVVEDQQGNLGYLSAFSGKLGNSNSVIGFVPPVFDTLDRNGFYKKGEEFLNEMNQRIFSLENDPEYKFREDELNTRIAASTQVISDFRAEMKHAKVLRKEAREAKKLVLSDEEFREFSSSLDKESASQHWKLKQMQRAFNELQISKAQIFDAPIASLKRKRADFSAQLQQRIFENYTFFNQHKETKNLIDLFSSVGVQPPAGAGECAAPKLFQFAFQHDLKPLCMAEFWWGKSPESEIRTHRQFYAACKGKCEPILNHMLSGIPMEPNPLETQANVDALELVYEDAHVALINKPADFLSVPGKTLTDSVLTRLKLLFPDATGPLLVHRLDMSTSGLLLMAKTQAVHKKLQRQFIQKTIQKRYVALLDGEIEQDKGEIQLPLRLDIDDRPKQVVCYDFGKAAVTRFEKIESRAGKTLVHFYPITGRTHQLRVHAAHNRGLNAPIVGDDLYGKKGNRLYLHAEQLTFFHPVLLESMTVTCPIEFNF